MSNTKLIYCPSCCERTPHHEIGNGVWECQALRLWQDPKNRYVCEHTITYAQRVEKSRNSPKKEIDKPTSSKTGLVGL